MRSESLRGRSQKMGGPLGLPSVIFLRKSLPSHILSSFSLSKLNLGNLEDLYRDRFLLRLSVASECFSAL